MAGPAVTGRVGSHPSSELPHYRTNSQNAEVTTFRKTVLMESGKVRGVSIQPDHRPLMNRRNQGTQRRAPVQDQRAKTQAKE